MSNPESKPDLTAKILLAVAVFLMLVNNLDQVLAIFGVKQPSKEEN